MAAADTSSDPSSASVDEPPAIWRVMNRIAGDKALATVVLFGCLLIKTLFVSRGDLLTSLAVLSECGLVAVVVGALLSSVPILAVAVFGSTIYWAVTGHWRWEPYQLWVWAVASGLAVAWFTPWYLTVATVVLALALALWDRIRHPASRRRRRSIGAGAVVLTIVLVVGGLYSVLLTMWLPHEKVVTGGRNPSIVVGYVLSDSNGWVTVLTSKDRRIQRISESDVVSRTVCRGSDFHESVIGLAVRHAGHRLNYIRPCPEARRPAAMVPPMPS